MVMRKLKDYFPIIGIKQNEKPKPNPTFRQEILEGKCYHGMKMGTSSKENGRL